jgi:hypothetical protein
MGGSSRLLHPDFGGPYGYQLQVTSNATPTTRLQFDHARQSDDVPFPFTASPPIEPLRTRTGSSSTRRPACTTSSSRRRGTAAARRRHRARLRSQEAPPPSCRIDQRGRRRVADLARRAAVQRGRQRRRRSGDPLHRTAHRSGLRVADPSPGRRRTRCIASADGRAFTYGATSASPGTARRPRSCSGDAALPPDSSPPTDRTGFSRARCRAAGPISSSPS